MASHDILPEILAKLSVAKFKEVANQKEAFEEELKQLSNAVKAEPSPRLKVRSIYPTLKFRLA